MFSRFYQGELAFLRAMGKEFALANPSTAGLLAERGGDPDVERLLEGFAFLAARVRERVEDCVPEIVHDLAEILLPHYLRPVPACCIVEFLPIPGALRARARVPRNAELASVPVSGTPCRFRTAADVDLLPVVVQDVVMDQAIGANPTIRIQLQAAAQALPAVFQPDGVRFYLHGELPLASTLLLWIARHLKEVEVRGLGPGGGTVRLPREAVVPIGFDPAWSLLPWPRFAPEGYRAIQEFFTLPQKFLFFDVRGLDAATAIAQERFEIVLRTERPPDLPARVTRETFRVNCVPVANLFPTPADPVSVRSIGEEHLVRASELSPDHMEIFAVESVLGIPEGPGERHPYEPFSGFRHAAAGRGARYYRLRRAISPIDQGLDTWLSVARPADAGPDEGAETLSIVVTATNRSLPDELRLGDVSQPTPTSPTLARFRNITAVSRPVRPPVATELHWRLLAHLAANRASVGDVEVLRGLLSVYNFAEVSDQQAGRANRLRIEGIRVASAGPVRRLVQGAPVRGTRVELELDEDSFAGLGDAWLFAGVVAELLAAQAPLNSFAELALRLARSERSYRFPPRSGTGALS